LLLSISNLAAAVMVDKVMLSVVGSTVADCDKLLELVR
jgi:hypothetical protein